MDHSVHSICVQPSVSGVTVSLFVTGLAPVLLSTFCNGFMV